MKSLSRLRYRLVLLAVLAVAGQAWAEGENADSRHPASSIASTHLAFDKQAPALRSQAQINQWLADTLAPQLGLLAGDQLMVSAAGRAIGGYAVYPVQQSHQQRPVVGNDSRLIIGPSGQPTYFMGKHQGYGEAASIASLSLAEALVLAKPVDTETVAEQLVYWPADDGRLILAYQLTGEFLVADQIEAQAVFISAENGELLQRQALEHTARDRHVADFNAACRDNDVDSLVMPDTSGQLQQIAYDGFSRLEGQGNSGSKNVDEVYDLLGNAYDFIASVYDMDSVNNRGAELTAFTNVRFHQASPDPQCIGGEFNAFWRQDVESLYLTADGHRFVEVMAHELGHGIIGFGSGLVYQRESGALNESIADAIGVGFRGWYELGHASSNLPAHLPDDIWRLRGPDGDLRNVKEPKRTGNYPDHYRDFVYMQADNGGVHINSSITNVGFYLLAAGGTHPRLGTGPSVEGIGLIKATQIYALAGAATLFSQADFSDARCAFAEVAEMIYGANSKEHRAVHQAMDAIGIANVCPLAATPEPPAPTTTDTQKPTEPEPQPEPEAEPPADPGQTPPPRTNPGPSGSGGLQLDGRTLVLLILGLAGLVVIIVALVKLLGGSKEGQDPSYGANQHYRNKPAPAPTPAPTPEPDYRASGGSYGQVEATIPVPNKAGSRFGRLEALDGSESIPLFTELLQGPEGQVLGRAAELVHVEMASDMVSRRHCRLRLRQGVVTIEDLNSSHGTMVDGVDLKPFQPQLVRSGQLIRIAGYSYVLHY
ncbi:M4 family metallopeptidase [Halioxenophilus sp. WMMB6]|uniref:M4 family metallopeptidase n=1 Tax=Halioxenophilus sp. WMMB6 TaxID=3073815 RepID=UPI00295E73C0|nr:M4 family metallopeptidase [Halioxenophilus sp. WMMB6]